MIEKLPLYCVVGNIGSGKDTMADIFEKQGFVKVALADAMKRFCADVFEWDEANLWGESKLREVPDTRYSRRVISAKGYTVGTTYLTPRHALQKLGTEWGREQCDDKIWLEYFKRVYNKIATMEYLYSGKEGLKKAPSKTCYAGVVVSDVRFVNEAIYMKELGAQIIKVTRTSSNVHKGTHASESEQDLVNPYVNYFIPNDSTLDDYITRVERFVKLKCQK